jgi:CTP synthase (UTP-ammonia lyase)
VRTTRVALVGDHDSRVIAHQGIEKSLQLLAGSRTQTLTGDWLATDLLASGSYDLSLYDAFWCVPASPYRSESGALTAIHYARTADKPFLGTCGGCQHAILEYARNVLGLGNAEHAELNPEASLPLISALSCSLVEVENEVFFTSGSMVGRIYGKDRANEPFHCRYGLNPKLEYLLTQSELSITGRDKNGEARAFEIKRQRFYVLTQYQPERSALSGKVHPIVEAFVRAAEEATGEIEY